MLRPSLHFKSKKKKKTLQSLPRFPPPKKLPGPWPSGCKEEEEEEINGTLNSLQVERKTRAAALFSQETQQTQMKARIWGKSLSLSLCGGGDAPWTRIQMHLCLGTLR